MSSSSSTLRPALLIGVLLAASLPTLHARASAADTSGVDDKTLARWQRAGVAAACTTATSPRAPLAQLCRRVAEGPVAADGDGSGGDASWRARAALVDDVLRMADRWATARPRGGESGARRARLLAHRAACDVALRFVLDVDAEGSARLGGALRDELVERGTRTRAPRRERACTCARRSTELALAADAPTNEQAELARIVASDPCGGRTSSPPSGPVGPDALRDNADATAIAARTSGLGVLREFALGRALDVGRCRDRHTRNGRIVERDKLEQCLCSVVRRWSLPVPRDGSVVQGSIPIVDETLELGVAVDAHGVVTSCGGLGGAALAP